MEKELWKDIIGYEGIYQISNFGRIKRLGYLKVSSLPNDNRIKHRQEIIVKPRFSSGYNIATLSKNGKKITTNLHRIVALHFIQNIDNKPEVNHKDGDKRNNNATNLEWCTRSENISHSHKSGLHPSQKGNLTSRSVKIYQYNKNGVYLNSFLSIGIASEKTGVPHNNIWQTVNGNQKTAGGYIWKK